MSLVKKALEDYLASPTFAASDFNFGSRKAPDFATRLEQARSRSRVAFWGCLGVLLVLFCAILFVSIQYFDKLLQVGPGKVTGIFGLSAGACISLMMHWVREFNRADYLIVLLTELRTLNPGEFVKVTRALAERWYGLKKP